MNEKEQQLAEFREDLRRMGPDGTTKTTYSMGCEVYISKCSVCGMAVPCAHTNQVTPEQAKIIREFAGVFVSHMCTFPPKYMDVVNKNMKELLG